MDDASEPAAEGASAWKAPLTSLLQQRRLREAMTLCARARPDFPDDPWLATMQAILHFRLGENEMAARTAAEALKLGSVDPNATLVLGVAHRRLGHHAQAAAALLEASHKLPHDVTVASMLIEETGLAHGLDRARGTYEAAVSRLSARAITTSWAKVLFWARQDEDIPASCVSAYLMSVPAWMARRGAEMEFVGEQEHILVEDPVPFGAQDIIPTRSMVPGYVPYACTLRDAKIFSHSSIVLMPDGAALNDNLAHEDYGTSLGFLSEKPVLHRRGDHLLIDFGQYRLEEIDAGIMLSGSVSEHFGHWVAEYLAKLYYLESHPRFAELPIIVDAGMPPQHLDYLRLLAPNPIVELPAGGALLCRELVVASPSMFFPVHLTPDHTVPAHRQGGLSPACMRFIQQRVAQRLPPPGRADRKLYLSRRKRGGRRPVNEDEISSRLAAMGFEIVFPEDMTLVEQITMMQAARVIVAPNGSSLSNLIFSPRTVRTFILSQRGLFNWATYFSVMRQLGYETTFICGDEELKSKNASYRVPLDRLIEALGDL